MIQKQETKNFFFKKKNDKKIQFIINKHGFIIYIHVSGS